MMRCETHNTPWKRVSTSTGRTLSIWVRIPSLSPTTSFPRSHIEVGAGLERVIGVVKKRLGEFETTFRTFDISTGVGLAVGEQFTGSRGVFSGAL